MPNLMPWRRRESELAPFRREFDNLLDRFWREGFLSTPERALEGRWLPDVDISENKNEVVVKAEIPGMEAKDIDISLDGRLLTLKGEKKQEKEEKDENYYRTERSYGYFSRSIELPADVDRENVDASYKKGVLTVKMKKSKESEAKKIEIKGS